MTTELKSAFTLAGGQSPLLNPDFRKTAFTLAEVLITLSIIGIVAALTIPGVVKHHNEKAWSTAQDLFGKKMEVGLRTMNLNATVSGFDTTIDFVNALKKYVKINKVCTDDITKCFPSQITLKEGDEPVTINSNGSNIEFEGETDEWAEPVGIQLSNGTTAIIAYNKTCSANAYDNQESVTPKCVALIYDVNGFKKPNMYAAAPTIKDVAFNQNVKTISGKAPCLYEFSNGSKCITKILGPNMEGGYTKLTNAECIQAKADGKIDVDYCYNGDDYYAGAVLACGGKKNNLPSQHQLALLATDLYNYNVGDGDCFCASCTDSRYTKVPGFSLSTEKASAFLAQSPGQASGWFGVWSSTEDDSDNAYDRYFFSDGTGWNHDGRNDNSDLAVCLGD